MSDEGLADATTRAMRLLARREHSERELRRKLAERGVADTDADAALAALKARNWQSDARFAESLVRRRLEAGYGPLVIEAELAAHGIDRAEATSLLADQDWNGRAREVVARRARDGAPDAAARRRLSAWLERRGFPAAAIRAALRAFGNPAEPEPD
jgi:regulatory protein